MGNGVAGPVQELLVPVQGAAADDRGVRAAVRLARVEGCPIRLLHVRTPEATGPEPDPAPLLEALRAEVPAEVTWQVTHGDEVAPAVLASAAPGSAIVMATRHANRWSGKASVSEHVLDVWHGVVVLVGPDVDVDRYPAGDVLVGVDGSPTAERALPVARSLADCLEAEVVLARVVPDRQALPDPAVVDPDVEQRAGDYLQDLAAREAPGADTHVVASNDPISALIGVADRAPVGLIVLSSRGDRASGRSTISRVCTGVAAAAHQPVVIVGAPGH